MNSSVINLYLVTEPWGDQKWVVGALSEASAWMKHYLASGIAKEHLTIKFLGNARDVTRI